MEQQINVFLSPSVTLTSINKVKNKQKQKHFYKEKSIAGQTLDEKELEN